MNRILANTLSTCLVLLVVVGFVALSVNARRNSNNNNNCQSPCVPGDEHIMRPKAHGTSETPVQTNLRWNCDYDTADRICNYNRHYAEYSGYFTQKKISFLQETTDTASTDHPVIFYDSNTGKALFTAPVGRSWHDFISESKAHGWPSFRNDEVHWDTVRVLENGETVSLDGTHLGHNLPDQKGNRYCINLVSIAGREVELAVVNKEEEEEQEEDADSQTRELR